MSSVRFQRFQRDVFGPNSSMPKTMSMLRAAGADEAWHSDARCGRPLDAMDERRGLSASQGCHYGLTSHKLLRARVIATYIFALAPGLSGASLLSSHMDMGLVSQTATLSNSEPFESPIVIVEQLL